MNSEKVFSVELRCAKLIFILRLKSNGFYGIIILQDDTDKS